MTRTEMYDAMARARSDALLAIRSLTDITAVGSAHLQTLKAALAVMAEVAQSDAALVDKLETSEWQDRIAQYEDAVVTYGAAVTVAAMEK